MNETEYFFSARLAYPWSEYPLGAPALGLLALLLVGLTLWTYLGHPQASRRRVVIVLVLRLLALVVALLTAVRPSVGIQEDPKLPSTLLVSIDLSESMTLRDEVNSQSRIAAVRKTLERCEPILEELHTEQNVNVVMYGFGPTDFAEATSKYDPNAEPTAKRSDYGVLLNRTFDRWQGEQFLRGHLVIGDGADNGTTFSAVAEAVRWRTNCPIQTFVVGSNIIPPDSRDVAITAVTADPSPVPIKNDLVIKALINAYSFVGATVPVKVSFDEDGKGYVEKRVEQVTLTQEKNNEVRITLKAPDKPGEIKVRVEVPLDSVPGDVAPQNNVIETYLTVTKEGVRVLLVNRLSFENAAIRRALAADKRIDLYQVIRQTDDDPTASEKEAFDFDARGYDAIIIGNVTARQLTKIDPKLPAKLREQVTKKGVGILFSGGHAAFLGDSSRPDATGFRGDPDLEFLMPVDLSKPGPQPEVMFTGNGTRYQYLPSLKMADHYLNKLANTGRESADLWARLNDRDNRSRFTGLSRIGTPKGTADVYAVASDAGANLPVPPLPATANKERQELEATLPPLLVGHQIGDGSRGRVLALAAQDTYLWQRLGQPKTNDGINLHGQFWRHMVMWLAHQEDEDAAAFVRPELRRLPVRGKQSLRVGLRGPGGADALNPKFEVKVIAPGETEATAQLRPVLPDPNGGFRVPYEPALPGEYVVKLVATGKTAEGADVKGEATARFLSFAEASDEMLITAANPEFLKTVATASGGQAHRLEDLPSFLKELKAQKDIGMKPKPRYLPDWRRNHSQGFLPAWLVVFVTLLGTEWALRRLWGMV